MNTRSKTRELDLCASNMEVEVFIGKGEEEFEIDFDYDSQWWKANKKYVGNGCYRYVCGFILQNNNYCQRNPHKNNHYCYIHSRKNKN